MRQEISDYPSMTTSPASPHADIPPSPRRTPAALWRWLTEPSARLPEAERRRVRLLSRLLLFSIGLNIIASILATLRPPALSPVFGVTLGTALCLALTYGLNRAGYYRAAATLLVAISALGTWAAVIADATGLQATSPLLILTFLPISVFLSSLLLSLRATMGLAILHLVGILLLPIMIPALSL